MRLWVICSAACLLAAGCTASEKRHVAPAVQTELPVSVLADTAERLLVGVAPWRAEAASNPAPRLTLQRVSPSRTALEPELPEAESAPPPVVDPEQTPREGLAIDDVLRPPIARGSASFTLKGVRGGWVELDVRVDEQGEVSDALVVEAAADSATQAAAVEAAYAVRFYPATQRGRPVAVWCRQRFEVGRR